jgi:hypothetical protein
MIADLAATAECELLLPAALHPAQHVGAGRISPATDKVAAQRIENDGRSETPSMPELSQRRGNGQARVLEAPKRRFRAIRIQ